MSLDRVKELRREYQYLKLIVIDEISLVGAKIFSNIDFRLREIFDETLPFGGISVLVLGDFNQIQPVMDNWVFTRKPGYDQLAKDMLWAQFKYFKLDEIMRQRDDLAFAQALSVLGNEGILGLSVEQINLLDTRIVTDPHTEIPKDAVFLFLSNENVKRWNLDKIKAAEGELFVNFAHDELKNVGKKETDSAKKFLEKLPFITSNSLSNLPNNLHLKLECKYMVISNLSISDGLVNGTVGVLKKIIFDSEKKYAIRLWFDFIEPDVGIEARNTKNFLLRTDKITDKSWTPFDVSTVKIQDKRHKFHVERKQFPLVECEAMTIHKVQGQTCTYVAIDINQDLQKSMLYVALSRTPKIEGLYLYGKSSIISKTKYNKMTEEKRREKIRIDQENSEVHKEINRMQEKVPFVNKFPFLEDNYIENKAGISIIFHNCRNYRTHVRNIGEDFGFMNTDILLLVECHMNPQTDDHNNTSLNQPGYTRIKTTGCREANAAHGQVILVKNELYKSSRVRFIADNSLNNFYDRKDGFEISILEIMPSSALDEPVYVVFCYNHPKNRFTEDLISFIETHLYNGSKQRDRRIVIFGDFNKDLQKEKNQHNKGVICEKLHVRNISLGATTDNKTHIDWCLTNLSKEYKQYDCVKYESYFSDHKPIWFNIYN